MTSQDTGCRWLVVLSIALAAVVAGVSCGSSGGTASGTPTSPSPPGSSIRTDAGLFQLITQTDAFGRYTVFPNAEELTTGRLNGSEAHRPVMRVSLNGTAAGALQNGRLPSGARFPDGSIVFKEIRPSATASPTLYAVMVKDSANSLAGNGWLWAEYGPTGSVTFSVSNRGSACTSCHQREQGPPNDLVRSFERQR
ncbi:MAG: cytochrome P460 family protein [Acidobacteria bacterium]|nr:cytochrome P460 family protein [Acidobacteriota bacterium]